MILKDLVKIDSRFSKSINLQLDINDKKKIGSYIPTRSSVNILKKYLDRAASPNGGRASILIGPYGKGKSHLLLVLLEILSGEHSSELEELKMKVASFDREAESLIKKSNDTSKFLPVIINTSSGNLSQAFIRSLNQALKRNGLFDVVPDSFFSEAIRTINMWKEYYPSAYEGFEKLVDSDINDFLQRLESYEYSAIETFKSVYPHITSGSEFNPLVDDDVLSVYKSINHILCEKYGYSGIYVVFDEFSKYIEGHTKEGFSADMKILQDICELCNASKDEQIHLICVAHKAIRSYGTSLPKSVLNAFRGVEGRLDEIMFSVSSQNNYELLSDAICKTDEFWPWVKNKDFETIIDESFRLEIFSSLFNSIDFKSIVGYGCFPLTPLCAALLIRLSERIAQNERTIFTFLSGKDLNSLSTYIERTSTLNYVGANLVYDYFVPLFEGEKETSIHNEWIKAEYAISKATSLEEKAVIKSIAVLKMINQMDDVPPKWDYIRLSLGMSNDQFSHAMDSLESKNLIVYRKSTTTYDFQNNLGANISNEVADYALKYFSGVDVFETLNEVFRKPYILPKKYNQSHYMTRYYRTLFMNSDTFMALSSSCYLSDKNEPDGYLAIVPSFDKEERKKLVEHIAAINENKIILGFAETDDIVDDAVRSLLAVRRLIENEDFISDNPAALTELALMEDELVEEINNWISKACQSIRDVYTGSKLVNVGQHGLNRAISDICEMTYMESPLINHELINRHYVSSQISKARNTIMEDMLQGKSMERYRVGSSAESTIYRAIMLNAKDDEHLRNVKREIIRFIHECKGRRVPFSVLINQLTDAPIGMRKGPIPILLMEQLSTLDDMPVAYNGKKELAIDAQLMNGMIQHPEAYSLFVETETVQKLEYIEGLERLFEEYVPYCRDIESRNRLSRLACVMQSWYRALPQTSKVFKNNDYHGQSIKRIEGFRKLFSGSVNPREALFEQLPSIFNESDYSRLLSEISIVKEELDGHIHLMKGKAISVIRNKLGLSDDDDLLRSIKLWYAGLPDSSKNSVLTSYSQRILNVIRDINISDGEEIAELLSKTITGFFVEDWNDNTIIAFSEGFDTLIKELEEKRNDDNISSANKVTLTSPNGTRECLYDFEPDNISPSAYFFKNALDEMIEEYGETLDNNEKIGILVQMVEKLMG